MKKFFLIFAAILVLIVIYFYYYYDNDNNVETEIEINYLDEVKNFDFGNDNINEMFLIWINDNYPKALQELNDVIKNDSYSETLWHDITNNSLIVLFDLYNNNYKDNKRVTVIDDQGEATIGFVGEISLADNFEIMPYYDKRKGKIYGILDENVVKMMNDMTIMTANNEFTFSDRGSPIPNKTYTFRGKTSRVSIYKEMGMDLVTLANNHVYDFGLDAFLDTLDTLDNAGIAHVGAGKNIEEAKEAYYYIVNGYKIGFVNATRAEKYILTPEATATTPGVLRTYDPTNYLNLIKEIKSQSDYVVALIHWGKEDTHELEQVQIDNSHAYIDAGADMLIGTHAHVLQGIEFYNNKPIVYNLGDFIFNRETKDTGIFMVSLDQKGNFSYQFVPCKQDDYFTSLLEDDEKQRVLNNMQSWSINTEIDKDGNLRSK